MRHPGFVFLALVIPAPTSASEVCLSAHPSHGNVSSQCSFPYDEFENAWVGFSESGTPCQVTSCDFTNYFYEWSISSSDIDPYENSSTLSDGVVYLHLWLVCAYDYLNSAAFRLELSPDLTFVTFEPAPGFLNAGTGQELLIASACSDYPVRAGRILLFRDTATSAPEGVDAETWGGAKSRYR